MASFSLIPDEPEHALPRFRKHVTERLLQRVEAMPEADFWSTLAPAGCGSGALTDRATLLARHLTPATLLAAGRRMSSLRFALTERLTAWGQSAGARLPLADWESRRDLASHVILLGKETYAAALEDPSRAWRLAEAGDFLKEGRTLFDLALEQYSLEALERALCEALPPVRYEPSVTLSDGQLIDHPEHGLGLVNSSYQAQFTDVDFRTGSYSFSGPSQEAFRQAVNYALGIGFDEEPEARWRSLTQLGWGGEPMAPDTLRERIMAMLPLMDCCAMGAWLYSLKRTLNKTLSKWDTAAGGTLAAALCPGKSHFRRIAAQVIELGRQAYEELLADPSRALEDSFVSRLKAIEPLTRGFDNPFDDARKRYPDADLLPALKKLHPERYHPSMTWKGYHKAVLSRWHGPGVVIGSGEGDEGLRVIFPHGVETLRGEEPPTPRELFLERAWDALMRLADPMPEAAFWRLVEQLGWGRTSTDISALAQELARKLSPLELEAMSGRLFDLRSALSRHLEEWEERKGKQQIQAGDDSFSDLVCHIIGLGELEYRRVLAKPQLAAKRARAGDYKESFDYVPLRARQHYSQPEVERALRQALAPARYAPTAALSLDQLIDHPEHGLGFVLAASPEGPVRVLFPDAERTL
jgi:hypothetical protein